MNLFDTYRKAQQDDLELGLRVACALITENETEPENFVRIMKLRHRWVEDAKKKFPVIKTDHKPLVNQEIQS